MKTYQYLSIALLALTGYACSSDGDGDEEPGKVAGAIVATIDGETWKTSTTSAIIINGTITIAGTKADGSNLTLSVMTSTTAGSYPVTGEDASVPDAIISFNEGSGVDYVSSYYEDGVEVGRIVITEIDTENETISGTFYGKVLRLAPSETELIIETGSFTEIPYVEETEPAEDNSGSAKINGDAFTPNIIGATKSFGNILINLSLNGTKTIAINVADNATVATHNFGSIGDDYYAMYTVSSTSNVSTSGSVVITLHNTTTKRIEGTFSFQAEPFPMGGTAVSITNGTFAVSY